MLNNSAGHVVHAPAAATVPETVSVNGRQKRVHAIRLSRLLENEALLAVPEMVIPLLAAVGRLTMLAAREKLGKSTLAAFLAAVVSCGRDLWGHTVTKGAVLWVGLEEEPGDAVRRFVAMGADPDHVFIIPRLPSEHAMEQLQAEIVAHSPRLVVVDSLAAFFRDIEDENGAAAWTKHLMPLVEIARTTRAAIVVLHHANRAQGSYRGSSAIGAAMDMILEMTESSTDATARTIKPRGRWAVPAITLRYVEETREWLLVDGDAQDTDAARAARLTAIGDGILAWLASQTTPATVTAIRQAMGGKGTDCDEALRQLVEAQRVIHLGLRKGYVLATGASDHGTPEPQGVLPLPTAG